MATTKDIDITKTGPQGFRQLQQFNNEDFSSDVRPEIREFISRGRQRAASYTLYNPYEQAQQDISSSLAGTATPWGESMFDKATATEEQFQNLGDVRAENQPWFAKLGAGVAKGVALAGTTFLDGTVGLVAGIAEGIGAKVQGESWGDSIAKLWNNEVSNGLASLNKSLEEILPNYRTQEEIDNPWYKNLGTINFWADSVIKNLGFTVGAFYSGGAGVKSIGAVKKLLKLGDMSTMGAKITGSILSAVNEGRVEANHGASDFLNLQFAQLADAIGQVNPEVQAMREYGLSDEEILDQLSLEDANIARLTEDARDRANAMGLTTLIGNSVLLSLNNFDTFGKLYARGFKNAETIANDRIKKEAGKYLFDKITTKEAIAKGIKHGLVEGNEEMSQAFISEVAGLRQSPDSPDAYYEALLDPNAEIETNSFLKSVTEGFANTYGNKDRWEEFAIGALTGILGIPTFGKVQNSDANTWLGRGKSIGVSGGIFGEIANANRENAEGQEAVDFMNNFTQKVQEQKGHFVRSQSFTNAMDGWAEDKNAFEYKNAEDNSDFSAISRFAKVGKLGDLKEMVDQDFENISDEELEKIAEFSSPEDGVGGWRNTDGSLMSSTEEGKAEMRNELSKKRDKILNEIDEYEKSVEDVRAIGNNSLSEDQVNELAWLNWKIGRFDERFVNLKKDNQQIFSTLSESLLNFRDSIDEESEEGGKWMKTVNNLIDFISYLQGAKSSLDLATRVAANKPLLDALNSQDAFDYFASEVGMAYSQYANAMNNLRDAGKLATAAKQFNDRYKEFVDNPIKLIENRESISQRKEKTAQAVNNVNLKDQVNNSSVSDIVQGINNGDLNPDELNGLFSDEDTAFLNESVGATAPTGKQKVEEAKNIIQTTKRANAALSNLEDESIDQQAIRDAMTLMKHSEKVAETTDELLDTGTQAFNDPHNLKLEMGEAMASANQEEIEAILGERIDNAKSAIERAKAILAEEDKELTDLPTSTPVAKVSVESATDKTKSAKVEVAPTETSRETTGHDTTTKVVTENERRKEEEAKVAEQQAKANKQGKINDFFNEARQGVSPENLAAFDKALSEVISNIDMLLSKNTPERELGKAIKDTQSYKTLKSLLPSIDGFLNTYVTHKKNKSTSTTKAEERVARTPVVTVKEIQEQTTMQLNSDPNKGELAGTYQYWKPTTSRIGQHNPKGDNTPYYIVAELITEAFKKKQENKPLSPEEKVAWDNYVAPGYVKAPYTAQQLKRMKAVYEYLERNGTFNLIDSGALQGELSKKALGDKNAKGDEVFFVIDNTLNDAAGEVVILMADSQGRILGDVMSPNDPPFAMQAYLPVFVKNVLQEYKEAGSPQHFTSSLSTVIHKNMVGRPPYLANHTEMNTLNAIHSDGASPTPFLIGVAASSGSNVRVLASAGRTKKQGQSDLERSINPPIVAKAGQPFLLLPTSSAVNHYMPVPIIMEPYSPSTQGTALGQAIHKVLERVPTADNSTAIGIISDLEELISVQEIHINYSGDNVKVTIKPNGAEHQMTIYNGSKSAPNIVEQLELGLQGQPFQVSRKYMNESYNGQDYNRMIGEVAKTNLPIGATHTISDWFTLKPIDAKGNIAKAKSPRSTGKNPHAAEVPEISVTKGGMELSVNTKTWEVSDGTKTYEGKNADKVKAYAFGIHTNKNMEQPYDTEWGYYDPKKDEFVEKPNIVVRSIGKPQVASKSTGKEVVEETTEQLRDKAKKAGLLNNKVREALWEALSPEQQSTIANKKGPKQKQWMDFLESAWMPAVQDFNILILRGSVDDFLEGKAMYRKTDGSERVWNKDKEVSWLSKVLPNLSTEEHLKIIDGLIKIVNSNDPGEAYGQFKQGVITISDQAASGTMYHEAFHAVTHTLLTSQEYKELFDAAKEKWGNLSRLTLEENLAEDFRRYVQLEETPIIGKVVKLYRTLKHLVQNLLGKEPYINRIFYSISRGKLATRKPSSSNVTRLRRVEDLDYLERSLATTKTYLTEELADWKKQRSAIAKIAPTQWRTSPTGEKFRVFGNNQYSFPSEAERAIPLEYSKVLKVSEWYGKYELIYKSKEEMDKEMEILKKSYNKEIADLTKKVDEYSKTQKELEMQTVSEELLQDDEVYYRRVEQYHRDKLLYDNLSQENKEYLQETGITEEEFKDMTQLEKEVLFKCKY